MDIYAIIKALYWLTGNCFNTGNEIHLVILFSKLHKTLCR